MNNPVCRLPVYTTDPARRRAAESFDLRRLRAVTKKTDRNGRCSRDTALGYSTVARNTSLSGEARKKRCSAPIYLGGTSTATRTGRHGKIPHRSKSRLPLKSAGRRAGPALRIFLPLSRSLGLRIQRQSGKMHSGDRKRKTSRQRDKTSSAGNPRAPCGFTVASKGSRAHDLDREQFQTYTSA
jgi:hypothetical protein